MTESLKLMLASQSPRRKELLTQIGVHFAVVAVDVPEVRAEGEAAEDYVQRLALSKARAGAEACPGTATLGADTVVVLAGRVLEKPRDQGDAQAMLAALSGATHRVLTAVAICRDGEEQCLLCESRVTFRSISPAEAARYWETGEPRDKAGAYGIQGFGAVFVCHLDGSYSNVVGLPLAETYQLLQHFAIPVWKEVSVER